ncbi:MAG: NeuD/PglB/VioB family sugar acetyltransferase [Aquificaceae bacterium]|nr:NeuD/PglB/VioB family sugar acetyltransferase [Aquificaceae bacterium]
MDNVLQEKEKVVIYGAGAIGRLAYGIFKRSATYEVVAFTADSFYVNSESFLDLPLLPFEESIHEYPPEMYKMFVAVGYRKMRVRRKMYEKAKENGYVLVNCIDKSALILERVHLGDNNLIFPNVVIETDVKIGSNNVFWTGVTICHDSSIGSHNFFASGVIIGGFCNIGNLNFIGFGSVVRENTHIPDEVLVGASSYVNKNPQPLGLYYGVPAKRMKELGNGVELS